MSYGYTLKLASLNKKASVRSLGVKLGRVCIKHNMPVITVASRLGVSRQTIYCWFSGKSTPNENATKKIKKLILKLEQ